MYFAAESPAWYSPTRTPRCARILDDKNTNILNNDMEVTPFNFFSRFAVDTIDNGCTNHLHTLSTQINAQEDW